MRKTRETPRESLWRRLEDLEWFDRCFTVITEAPDIGTMISGVRNLLLERFQFDRIGIIVGSWDPRFCLVHEIAAEPELTPVQPGSLMVIAGTALEWAFREQTLHYSPDIAVTQEFQEDGALAAQGIHSVLRVPLVFQRKVFGILTMASSSPDAFTPAQRSLLENLGRRVSAGLHALHLIQGLRDLSLRDPLTNVFNRHFLKEVVTHPEPIQYLLETTRMAFPKSDVVSVLFIDLIQFKDYNDTFGHAAGDKALLNVATTLTVAVSTDGVVIRFGGDEFVILLPGRNAAAAKATIAKIRNAFPIVTELGPLGLSLGAATGTWDTLDSIIQSADASMYSDKNKEALF